MRRLNITKVVYAREVLAKRFNALLTRRVIRWPHKIQDKGVAHSFNRTRIWSQIAISPKDALVENDLSLIARHQVNLCLIRILTDLAILALVCGFVWQNTGNLRK